MFVCIMFPVSKKTHVLIFYFLLYSGICALCPLLLLIYDMFSVVSNHFLVLSKTLFLGIVQRIKEHYLCNRKIKTNKRKN